MSNLIETEQTRTNLPAVMSTNDAAAVINRRPQTLRRWACMEDGPIIPLRINRRLAWLVSDLRRLLTCDLKESGNE